MNWLFEKGATPHKVAMLAAARHPVGTQPPRAHPDILKVLLARDQITDLKTVQMLVAYAATNGYVEILELLIEHFDGIKHDILGRALFGAAQHGCINVIKFALEVGDPARPETKKFPGWQSADQALLLGAMRGDLDAVRALLRAGANCNAHNAGGSALSFAVLGGSVDIVKTLLEAGSDVHYHQELALLFAADEGRTEIVKLLAEAGANVRLHPGFIYSAAQNGHAATLKALLDAGATLENDRGDFFMLDAAKEGRVEVVKVLIEAGVNPCYCNYSPIRSLVNEDDVEAVKVLLDAIAWEDDGFRAVIREAMNKDKITLLDEVVEGAVNKKGFDAALELLSRPGLSVHSRQVALIRAAERGLVGAVKVLVASIGKTDTSLDGTADAIREALDKAAERGDDDVVAVLMEGLGKLGLD
ncbi:hypothetical protein HDV00_000704 [Rhizophlyctis rosea]|nr:hypothetical protein HDV00_000704 [Rhizophlyctis rosea]